MNKKDAQKIIVKNTRAKNNKKCDIYNNYKRN